MKSEKLTDGTYYFPTGQSLNSAPSTASAGYDFQPVGIIARHTGSLKDMAIIVWNEGQSQPPEGTILYIKKS